MSDVDIDPRTAHPVPVEVKNWAPPVKPSNPITRTTIRTYVLDPAGSGAGKSVQVCDYEPNRMRMAVLVVDAAVTIATAVPVTSPGASTATLGNEGGYLPPNAAANVGTTMPYEFFGPDAMWLNSMATITRVTVIKEYCG